MLIGGCDNAREQPSTPSQSDEISRPAQLTIQTGDSLLFTQAQSSVEKLNQPGTGGRDPIIAYSYVEPSQALSTIKSFQPGTLIHLSLDENLIVTARINRNQAIGDEITTLTGPLLNPHSGNIILSIDQQKVSGSIDLLIENRLFYIRYDRENSLHYIAEIDRSKLDILEGSEPHEY